MISLLNHLKIHHSHPAKTQLSTIYNISNYIAMKVPGIEKPPKCTIVLFKGAILAKAENQYYNSTVDEFY